MQAAIDAGRQSSSSCAAIMKIKGNGCWIEGFFIPVQIDRVKRGGASASS